MTSTHPRSASAVSPIPVSPNLDRALNPPASNDRLRALCPRATLGAVARATGLNVEYISRIFNLKRRPSLRTAQKIASFLGVSLGELVAALEPASDSASPSASAPLSLPA